MIKRFLSKALLSVVMDKSARENLENKKKIKQAYKALADANQPPVVELGQAPQADSSDLPLPDPLDSLTAEETRQLILDSLKAAEEELESKPEITAERQALIQEALSVQRSKAHILDHISEEQRQKLTFMALQSLKTDPGSVLSSGARNKKKGNK